MCIRPQDSEQNIIMEWKVLQITYLKIPLRQEGTDGRIRKAKTLSGMDIDEVLEIKFETYDKYHPGGKSINDWVNGRARLRDTESPKEQLSRYITDGRYKTDACKAYLIVIVGSRKIVVWEMDARTRELQEPRLADWVFNHG